MSRPGIESDDGEITVTAPAKVNIFLAVKGRRADGYHEIFTLMHKLELADHLIIRRGSKGIRLDCPGSVLPKDENNLAFRAARFFFQSADIPAGVDITLHKHIPVAAGLGGGSSDAAAVLCGLNALFGAGLDRLQLLAMARKLGADVSFFVCDWPAAWASGIGELLQPAPSMSPCWLVLVNPGFPVPTKWVYDNFALTSATNQYTLASKLELAPQKNLSMVEVLALLFNDLESVTVGRYPEIASLKEDIVAAGALGVLMSGSGPTVFGLFSDQGKAEKCVAIMAQRQETKVFLTRFQEHAAQLCSNTVSRQAEFLT